MYQSSILQSDLSQLGPQQASFCSTPWMFALTVKYSVPATGVELLTSDSSGHCGIVGISNVKFGDPEKAVAEKARRNRVDKTTIL